MIQRLATILKTTGVLIKKINLLNETIAISNDELTQVLNSHKEFGITLEGEIRYKPFDPANIFIYQGKVTPPSQHSLSAPGPEHLGTHYEIIENDERILVKAGNAWKDVISYNLHHCHYDNMDGEGVTQFADEEIEDMGWMIIDFDVSYAELLKMLEEKTDVTLVCVESENDPYRFMGYFNDIKESRKVLFDFCQNIIKDKIANDVDYALDLLDEDQCEAAEFFQVL